MDDPDEDYFVAKIEESALKQEDAGTYSTMPYRKNDLIAFVR